MHGRRGRRPGALCLAVAAVLATGCGSGQDPGVPVTDDGGVTRPSSQTLAPCPAGGPDATTPSAGCLDPDGNVLRP